MKQPSIVTLMTDDKFEGFLLVGDAKTRQDKNGRNYLDMTLKDKSGDLNAKCWTAAIEPKAGDVVKVRSVVSEYQGRKQLKVEKIRPATEEDQVDLSLLMACAPEKPEVMMALINQTIDDMKTPDLQKILREMIAQTGDKLLYFPAAQKLHHAEKGGLLHHTTNMLKAADALLPLYDYLDADLLKAGIIAHDLSKTAEYISDPNGCVSDYSTEGLMLGHLVRGVAQVQQAAQRANVTGEYVLLLSHMVISHHGTEEFGSPRAPMFPEAEMLHMLDDLDAKMDMMESVVRRTPMGAFSEKVWSLDRRVYHPRYLSEMPANSEQPLQKTENTGDQTSFLSSVTQQIPPETADGAQKQ